MVRLAMGQYFKGDFERAQRELEQATHPVGVLNTLRVPRGYRSEDEITAGLERYDRVLAKFEQSDRNDRQWASLFDGLTMLETFELPYTGRDVTSQLIRVGALIEKIVSKAVPSLVQPLDYKPREKVRVAYISPHFKAHNGARWAEGWIEAHQEDPDLEIYVFNLAEQHDFISHRIAHKVHLYEHLSGPIHHIAKYLKQFQFDVVTHPAIGMSGRASQIAAMRLAPVQMTAWGHPTTSGMESIDYYLSGDLQEPWNGQEHYSEKLVRLPGSGLTYKAIEDGPSDKPTGLPEDYMVIAQNILKAVPKWDYLYKEVQVKTGMPIVLIGPVDDLEMVRFKERMDALNVEYIGVGKVQRDVFLKIVQDAKVSLDTPAWSGGNTTIEAIHLGTPVVTLPGEFMRGRHSYCFLKEAGLERFIAKDAEDFVSLASEAVKERLPQGAADPIFDNKEPGRALNRLLKEAAGEPTKVCQTKN